MSDLIFNISATELMALTDDELAARRIGLAAQELSLRVQRETQPATDGRLAGAHTHTIAGLHAARLEAKRRGLSGRPRCDAMILDAAWQWGCAARRYNWHQDECGTDPCETCDEFGEKLNRAEDLLHAALDAKHENSTATRAVAS